MYFYQYSSENATPFVVIILIVLSTIYSVSINNKVKFKEAATGGVLYKKLFLKILPYSQKNTCVGVSFLIKLQTLSPVTLLKRDPNTSVSL